MNIDRRIIYVLILLALLLPLQFKISLPAVHMRSADKAYSVFDTTKFEAGDIAFLALDFGPSTMAENQPQAEAMIEHLLRRRIPFVVFSQYVLATPFLRSIPERVVERLKKDNPTINYQYGKDWVNLGFKPNGSLFIQGIPKAEDLREYFKSDDYGTDLNDLELTKDLKSFSKIKLLGYVSGLRGILTSYIDFFQNAQHRPVFVHGCTSIAIPEAYIFLDSQQLAGLLEGIAGAAWYSELLSKSFKRSQADSSQIYNTMLAVAHVVIILLIIAGNIGDFILRRSK